MTGARTLAAVAGLVLVPFGDVSEHLKHHNPWTGFDAQDANLVVVRAEQLSTGVCAAWTRALGALLPGAPISIIDLEALKSWEPWNEEDLHSIRKCDSQPCDMKLGDGEVAQLKATPENGRLAKYQDFVVARAKGYLANQERKEYEFPGAITEPWSYFERRGFKTELKIPAEAHLFVRKLDLAPGQARTLHQILDRRIATSSRETVIWVRDLYDDHYFDSWGEWTQLTCSESGEIRLVQALFFEFDLLKKSDLISRIMRGKMKGAVETQGIAYLNRTFEKLRQDAAYFSSFK